MTDETVAYMGWGISAQEQIDGFRREVRELKAENDRLREQVADACMQLGGAWVRCTELMELVRLAYAALAWADGATFNDGTPAVHACDRHEVEECMRVLGVEVD